MDEAGIKSVAVPGFEMPTDRNGQLWVHFAPHDQARYVSAIDVLEGRVTADRVSRRLVLIGTSAAGLLDLKTTPIDPAMPGVEVHAQVLESILTNSMLSAPNYAVGAELRAAFVLGVAIIVLAPILGAGPAAAVRRRHHRAAGRRRPGTCSREHKLLIDFTFPLLSSLLIYLTLVFTNYVRNRRSGARSARRSASICRPTLVEQLAQSPEKLVLGGEAARHDDHVQRRARLHHDLGDLQGRSAGPDRADEQLPDAADQRHHRSQGHDRQIHGRRDHGVLERAARRPDPRAQRLRGGARHARPRRAAQPRARGSRRRPTARRSSRSRSASASTPARAWSATWAPTCASTIRCWATASISPRGWKANASPTGCRSSSARGPRRSPRTSSRILELDFIAVKGKKEPEVVYAIVGRDDLANSGRFQRWRELNMNMLSRYRSRDWTGALAAIEAGPRRRRGEPLQDALRHLFRAHPRVPDHAAARRLGRRLRAGNQVSRPVGHQRRLSTSSQAIEK